MGSGVGKKHESNAGQAEGHDESREPSRKTGSGTARLAGVTPEPQAVPARRKPGELSDEPLINAIHRRVVEIVFVAYVSLLVYISFVPFDFTRSPPTRPSSGTVWGLPISPFGLPDIFANIALYIPFGALAFAVWRRRKLGRIISGLLAALLVVVISFIVEQGQHWVISRVSTWVDVASNLLGGLIGATLVAMGESQIRHVVRRAGQAARHNWWLILAKATVCIVLIAHLRPYDVVVDVFHTAAESRHADLSPLSGWNNLPDKVARHVAEGRRRGLYELPRVQWEYALDRSVDVATYAAVVALLALGLAPQFPNRTRLYLWSGFVGVSIAAMVTVIRIFLITHGLDTAHFLCGLLGWPLGCAVAHLVLRNEKQQRALRGPPARRVGQRSSLSSPVALPIAWRNIILGATLAVVLAYELVPFDFAMSRGADPAVKGRQVCLLPFEAHFHSRPNDAFFDLSGELLRYGVVGICLGLALQGRTPARWRRRLGTVVVATGTLAVVLESLHLVMATRQTDLTTLLVAMIGGFVGAVAVKWAADYRASVSVVVADDLLTGQLMEGETGMKEPAVVDDLLTRQLIEGETRQNAETSKRRNAETSEH
jgi:glycopeptide antibiotics resistance protein